MAKMCRRLSAVERVRIELGLRDGLSLTRIAEAIGRPKVNGVQGDRPPRRRWGLCRRRGPYPERGRAARRPPKSAEAGQAGLRGRGGSAAPATGTNLRPEKAHGRRRRGILRAGGVARGDLSDAPPPATRGAEEGAAGFSSAG